MSVEGSNEPEEWEYLNREALLALGLARPSIIDPIVTLLRSEAPLDPIVRNAIADAFEGKRPGGAPQFVVKGTGRGAHVGLSRHNFQRDVSIARFVADQRQGGMTLDDAVRAAADQFRMSTKTCEAAVTKTAKMDKWLADHPMDRNGPFSIFSDEEWARFRADHYWGNFVYRDE